MNSQSTLTHTSFLQRENSVFHSSYSKELAFYNAVKSGDVKEVKACMSPLNAKGFGVLSKNEVRNFRYHLIISIAFITRFCMEAGMPAEDAYNLSDLYIQKADIANTTEEIFSLHQAMIFDFTKRMHDLKKQEIFSKPIRQCLDYIYENLHHHLSIPELASYVGLNPTYLSTLFKQEVGLTVVTYIRHLRIESAQNMLRYSEYTPLEIGNYLCFSLHSYFISVFKKEVGMTPREYQQKFFQTNWL